MAAVSDLMGNVSGRPHEGSARQGMTRHGVLESRLITGRTIQEET